MPRSFFQTSPETWQMHMNSLLWSLLGGVHSLFHSSSGEDRGERGDLGWDPGLSTGILQHALSPRTPGAPAFCCLCESFYRLQRARTFHLARNQRPDPPALTFPVVPERRDDAERRSKEKVWENYIWRCVGWLELMRHPLTVKIMCDVSFRAKEKNASFI